MAKYLTRVELHNASFADYEKLHTVMAQKGFARTIRGDNGFTYQLPTAEYYLESSATLELVLTAAKQAATSTGRTSGVISVEYTSARWEGLTQI